ncbi:hypothetical protein AB0J20_18295 [Micromonospora costi]|uniref:DUF6907 domain-containing protein n=1 Tax=Micromonospora costi TaxID=1530042 RepID=UPI0033FFB3DD
MNIIASAPVPPANRLNDAPTADLAAIRRNRPADSRFPLNGTYASRSAETTPALLDAASPEFRDGYARGYADALGRAAAARPTITDADLVDLAAHRNPAGVHQLAETIRNGCPPWCSEDHRGQVTEVDGFSLGLCHERVLTEVTALDPAWQDERPSTATVLVESTTERGEVITAPRIVLTVSADEQGHYVGTEDTEGWTGTPEQARALAAALVAAASLIDGNAR